MNRLDRVESPTFFLWKTLRWTLNRVDSEPPSPSPKKNSKFTVHIYLPGSSRVLFQVFHLLIQANLISSESLRSNSHQLHRSLPWYIPRTQKGFPVNILFVGGPRPSFQMQQGHSLCSGRSRTSKANLLLFNMYLH